MSVSPEPSRAVTRAASVLRVAFTNFKLQDAEMTHYEPAELVQGKGDWYVLYYFKNDATGKMERFREHFDMNRIKDKGDRLIYGRLAVKFVNQKLKEGFNPFAATKATELTNNNIVEQLADLVKRICAACTPITAAAYRQQHQRLLRFIEFEKLQGISMRQVNNDTAEVGLVWLSVKISFLKSWCMKKIIILACSILSLHALVKTFLSWQSFHGGL